MIKGDWFITTIKLRAVTEISYGVSHKDLKLTLVCASAITTDCRKLKKWGGWLPVWHNVESIFHEI